MGDGKRMPWFQGSTSFGGAELRVYEGDGFRNHLIATAETAEAARLIVAAPDLLTSLARVQSICLDEDEDDHVAHILEVVSAAIAKAEGRS